MGIVEGLGIVLLPFFLGFYLGNIFTRLGRYSSSFLMVTLSLLLFIMGFKLGQIENLATELPRIGVKVVIFTVVLHLCNFLFLMPCDHLQHKKSRQIAQVTRDWRLLLDVAKLILSVVVGVIAGLWAKGAGASFDYNLLGTISNLILLFMILASGIQLGSAKYKLKEVLLNKEGFIISVLFTLSCLVAGLVCYLITDVPLNKSLAYTAGMGWYSLSSVILANAWGPLDGSMVFFIDMARELLALVLVPLLMQRFRCTAVTQPGATSLDCSLPIIQRSGGNGVVGLAITFGFFANLYVPVLLVLFTGM
ncbi:lysine exporter LysO family protein [Psittacicella hinzii]|uniref:Lysine exporter LysO family protein n=2 Tax=Psittacicella hinzii TaxID=2028575 RepID=A0A3A1YVU2_9GAMM|nr:hypothetical protein CKF58_00975 [Psittacicella hinzii]